MTELPEEVRAFLDAPHFAVLATIGPDGLPAQSVMWYLRDGDEILFNTKVGRAKERHLRADPRVSLVVGGEYRYVRLTGRVLEIRDPATTQADIHRLAVRYTGAAAAAKSMERFSLEERVSYRLSVARVYRYGL